MKNTKNTKIPQYVLVLVMLFPAACAYDEDDLECGCSKTKELNLGEGISCGNYMVVAYNFPRSDQKSFVGIKLSENGVSQSDVTGFKINFVSNARSGKLCVPR